jgi:FkbM family methyltransferase
VSVLKKLLSVVVRLTPNSKLADLRRLATVGWLKLNWILNNSPTGMEFSDSEKDSIIRSSKSQLGQDVLALSVKGLSQPGFFVEFGATNGFDLSNTFMLETKFGWTGILSEPARQWHKRLKAQRNCSIDHRCVYSVTGENVGFMEAKFGELSTISGYEHGDSHSSARDVSASYEVETISLIDLLKIYKAPPHIDFLSIDTEGSEFEILQAFDFDQYKFGLICVEHNYTPNRVKIFELLSANGYERVHESLSDFDDWYVQGTNS